MKDAYNSGDEDSLDDDEAEYGLSVPHFSNYEIFPVPREIVYFLFISYKIKIILAFKI